MENHHFLMGKSTISMVIFNSKLLVYQRVNDSVESSDSSDPHGLAPFSQAEFLGV